MIVAANLEIDLLIPSHKLAIEVDGITHYYPVYGQERLEMQQNADRRKDGLLMQAGISVLRLKCLYRKVSPSRKEKALNHVLDVLEQFERGERFEYSEIEIT